MSGVARKAWFAVIWLVALGAAGQASAQASRTEAEVVAAVRAHSPALRAAASGATAEAHRPAQVRWPFPMVDVMPMPAMTLDGDPGAQVMLRQAVPWPGRLAADRAARTSAAEAASFEAAALDLDVVTAARTAYARLWGLQEQADRTEAYVARLELYREAALAQYRAGRGPQQAVLGIQLEAEMLGQRLDALAEDRIAVAARLTELAGGELRVAATDRLAPPSAPPTGPDATAASGELESHPMLRAGRAMESAEASMVDLRRTMLRPEVTVGVNLNLSRMAFDRMYGQEAVMPAVGVVVPLWRGGVRAEVREAEERVRQRALETAAVRAGLEAELEDVTTRLERVRARIARYEQSLRPQVEQTLEASLAGYQAGTTGFLELLDAQRMALDVDVDLIEARVQAAELTARLDAVAGRVGHRTEDGAGVPRGE